MDKNVYFCPMDNTQKQNTYGLADQMTDQEKLEIIHHLQTILLSTHLPETSSLLVDESSAAKPAEELDKNCRNDGQPWISSNPYEKTQNASNESKFMEKDKGGNLKKLKNNKGKVQPDYLLKKNEQDIDKRYKERILWKKHIDGVEPVYRLRTLIFLKHKYQKKEAQRMLGPGSYDPLYYHQKSEARKQSQTKGQMKSCAPRLVLDTIGDCESFPNPNKYYEAWTKLEAAYECRCHPGKVPLFQSTPCMKSRPTQAKLDHLGPALYNIKSPLEEFIKKKTSKRGPYDLYTPPRDIIPYGPRQTIRSPLQFFGFYEIAEIGLGNVFRNSADYQKGRLMSNSRNRRITGERISYESTLWPKNENLPGPGHYFVNNNQNQSKRNIDNQKHTAFGVGIGCNARPSNQNDIGTLERSPNRYEIVRNVHIKGHGHKSAFKSSLAGNRLDLKKLPLLQERLEPTKTDLPPGEINNMNFCIC